MFPKEDQDKRPKSKNHKIMLMLSSVFLNHSTDIITMPCPPRPPAFFGGIAFGLQSPFMELYLLIFFFCGNNWTLVKFRACPESPSVNGRVSSGSYVFLAHAWWLFEHTKTGTVYSFLINKDNYYLWEFLLWWEIQCIFWPTVKEKWLNNELYYVIILVNLFKHFITYINLLENIK